MSTRFVLSWIGPTIERDVETNRYATFLQNTLGRIQSDLQIDAVKVSDFSAGKRRVTLDKTDMQNMRAFNINTSDPKAVALYAREKLAAQ